MTKLHGISLSFFLLLISMSFYVSAYPNGAGTCNVEEMSTIGHMTTNLKGSAGYSLNATMQSQGKFNFVLSGPGDGVEGLLVYVLDSKKNRVGQFSNLPSNMKFKTDCSGPSNPSTPVTHTDSSPKKFPINLTWNIQGSTDQLTIKSLVVKDFNDWAILDDVSLNPVSGESSLAAPSAGSQNTTPSTPSDGFLQKYSLFIIMIAITTLLYIVGSVTEAMLKRQQVKSRSFAKTIQNGFGDSR